MNKDFVTFELAKKLKEKGFSSYSNYGYNEKGDICIPVYYLSEDCYQTVCDCPEIHEVLKWLREDKKLHIVCPFYKDEGYYFYVQAVGCAARIVSSFDASDACLEDFEQAALAGIEYTLDNLI